MCSERESKARESITYLFLDQSYQSVWGCKHQDGRRCLCYEVSKIGSRCDDSRKDNIEENGIQMKASFTRGVRVNGIDTCLQMQCPLAHAQTQ